LLSRRSPLYHFQEVAIMASQPALISGVIRDPDGEPVGEARVYFKDGPVPLPDVAALTDSRGAFTLPAPAAGAYKIECSADGFKPKTVTVKVAAGKNVKLDIRLKR
jgi:Carboxypeptidase regulatory-like domain